MDRSMSIDSVTILDHFGINLLINNFVVLWTTTGMVYCVFDP